MEGGLAMAMGDAGALNEEGFRREEANELLSYGVWPWL